MKRALTILGVAVATLLVTGLIAVHFFFDASVLGRRVLDDLERRTGFELEARSFDFGLFRGLRIERVTADGPTKHGDLSIRIETIVLEHRLRDLIRGRVVFDRVRLIAPSVVVDSLGSREILGRGGPVTVRSGGDASVDLAISRVEIDRGHVEIRKGTDISMADGVAIQLGEVSLMRGASTPLEGLEARGSIRVESMDFGDFEANKGKGRLEMRAGHVRVDEFQFEHAFGPMTTSFDLDLTSDPFTYRLDVESESVDLARALRASGIDLELPATLELNASGTGPRPEDLLGTGTIVSKAGVIPASPIVLGIEALLGGGVRIAGARFSTMEVRFVVADHHIEIEPFALAFEDFAIHAEGDVDLDGPLDLRMRVVTEREGVRVRGLPEEIYDVLTDAEGRVVVPIDVVGTLEDPRATINWTELGKMTGRSLRDRGEDLIRRGLEKLLGKD